MLIKIEELQEKLDSPMINKALEDYLYKIYCEKRVFSDFFTKKQFVVKAIEYDSGVDVIFGSIEIDRAGHIRFSAVSYDGWFCSSDIVVQEYGTFDDSYIETNIDDSCMQWDSDVSIFTMNLGDLELEGMIDYDEETQEYQNLRVIEAHEV
jgi:hypothetical protein